MSDVNGQVNRESFESFAESLQGQTREGENLFLSLTAEDSQFIRMSGGRVRQIGTVDEAVLGLTYVLEHAGGALRTASETFALTGDSATDLDLARTALERLRQSVPALPEDPFARLPQPGESTESVSTGELPPVADAAAVILPVVADLDFTGIYAGGRMVRASSGVAAGKRAPFHWFETETFSLDYSIASPSEKAVKGSFSSSRWDPEAFASRISRERAILEVLALPAVSVPRGDYRVYLGPQAVADLVSMFSWGCIGEAAIRQGDSPLRFLRDGSRSLSPLFTLRDDFTAGDVPRFNEAGELSPETLTLIGEGKLVESRVSTRSHKEYGMPSNGAGAGEGLQAPSVAPGSLDAAEAMARIGDGLYLPNLHYLNWSDQPGGRVTGMTRYACLRVKGGKAVGPIEDLRFDDSIFRVFGSELEGLTRQVECVPDVGSYEFRSIGAIRVPGMLLKSMRFTL